MIMITGDSIRIAKANATPWAARLIVGSGRRAIMAARKGPSAAIISQVADSGDQNRVMAPREVCTLVRRGSAVRPQRVWNEVDAKARGKASGWEEPKTRARLGPRQVLPFGAVGNVNTPVVWC